MQSRIGGTLYFMVLQIDPTVTDVRSIIAQWLAAGVARIAPGEARATVAFERPKQASHGDFATSVALQLAKLQKQNPRELAARLGIPTPAGYDDADQSDEAGIAKPNVRLV